MRDLGANQGKSYDPQVVVAHTSFMGDTGWLTYRKSPSQPLTGTCPKAEETGLLLRRELRERSESWRGDLCASSSGNLWAGKLGREEQLGISVAWGLSLFTASRCGVRLGRYAK